MALEARGLIPAGKSLRIGLGGSLGYQRWDACLGVEAGASDSERCGDEGPFLAVDLRTFIPVGAVAFEVGLEPQVSAGPSYTFFLAAVISAGVSFAY